ncbi:CocE/NonD family hydrolase [Sphingomonas sp. So64.6b]|uniref:CocE/NonD family hydrolase n=1 Tax=Sphingomonas sp. So64.6b TaxID=2997354 RepID=UPI0016006139|nr:CocE/NonD family hydrolase [Sphingomonas sp. So64.6b]QNA84344.1 CocE/NonD family hydrolase [Sphingomonas sp. So64.6b]
MRILKPLTAIALLAATSLSAIGYSQTAPMTPDNVAAYDPIREQADYVRKEVMIPMRDGVKLFTVIVMRKGTKGGPILLSRTPYNAGKATMRNRSQKIEEILPISDAEFVNDGYIRVYQDVRGLDGSEGDYVMTRPLSGPLNDTKIDHSTDAYDTIDWLVKNVPESNGKVGITGSSYLGFTSLMALINPHPALKAAVPQSPMVDGWVGDDWFHNGAFRMPNFAYILGQTAKKGGGAVPYGSGDEYDVFLNAGSAGDFAKTYGVDSLPYSKKLMEHPAYDEYWQDQAVDKLLAKRKLTVPTMLVVGQWDQEDSYGAPAVYKALEPQDKKNDMVTLVIGPWRHSGVNYDGSKLGDLDFAGDTGLQFRRDYMKPFLDRYLKDGAPAVKTPSSLTYATGIDKWEARAAWPAGKATPLYLQGSFGLSWDKPAAAGRDDYVSDPARPVPYLPRPVLPNKDDAWRTWLVKDQRFVSGRTDVLEYTTTALDKDVHIAGQPMVDLFAATSGSDSDWVVKLIDVYPQELTSQPKMAGFELPIGIEIYRGRYVHGFSTPAALTPGKVENYKFGLPNVNHVFKKGHRIMVQVQSSLFPLYDRNPQSYVPNIFWAKPGDYKAATQTVVHAPDQASAVWLPVVD